MKSLILFFGFLLCGCGELPFTNEDTPTSTIQKAQTEVTADTDNIPPEPPLSEEIADIPEPQEEVVAEEAPPEEPPFLEEEITVISEDLELKEDTVIKNRKVVLDMVAIKTQKHNLFIIAEEFLSNHSVIRNFTEDEKAKKWNHGRNGGNILIEAEKAIGELQLVMNGEKAGHVPRRATISKSEKKRLKGRDGRNGQDAVYKRVCHTIRLPLSLHSIGIPLFPSAPIRNCWYECASPPTEGEDGGRGRRGVRGPDGKNGGGSGSFHLKAFEFSDFHLVNIQNTPGIASKGGKGSIGGYGGKRGRNGNDRRRLCDTKLSRTEKGDKGRRGHYGNDGIDGRKGEVCLEKLISPEEKRQKELEESPPQQEIKVVCNETNDGHSCREVLEEKKENIICY